MQKFLIVIFLLFALDSMAQFSSNRATKTDEIQSNTTSNIILNPTTDVILDNLTGNTVPYLNGSKAIKSSSVTDTELGYLSGVTSSVQTQLNAKVDDATTITTTSPLFIDGIGSADLSANRTLSIQQATSLLSGFLSSTDWNTFNNKVSATRSISTTSPLTGGGDLSADRTIAIPQSSGSQDGYLSSTDWTTFNNKFTSPLTTKGDLLSRDASTHVRVPVGVDGYILSADSAEASGLKWITLPATSPLTTKGDIFTYSTNNDRLPVGANGQLIKANSATATGLEWFTHDFASTVSPAFTGNPTAPTQAPNDNSTKIATTAYVDNAIVGGATFDALLAYGFTVPLHQWDSTSVGYYNYASPDGTTAFLAPKISPDGAFICRGGVVAGTTVTLFTARDRDGFGSSITEVETGLTSGLMTGCGFSKSGRYFGVGRNVTPFFHIYGINNKYSFSALTDPATVPPATVEDIDFSEDDSIVCAAHTSTPYISVYRMEFSSPNDLIKIANPVDLPTGNATSCKVFSREGLFGKYTYVAVAHTTTPFITLYRLSGSSLIKLADPATLPTGNAQWVSVSPKGDYISVSHTNSPYLTVYSFNGATMTKLNDPSTPVLITSTSMNEISTDGKYIAVEPNFVYQINGSNIDLLATLNTTTCSSSTGAGIQISMNQKFIVGNTTTGGYCSWRAPLAPTVINRSPNYVLQLGGDFGW
jgi:hypothetical protein